MISERAFLMSEVKTLESLITSIPDENIIDKKSLESRLKKVKTQLEELAEKVLPLKAAITFKGEPVKGTRGISADFASSAMRSFAKIFVSVAAYLGGEELKNKGQLPNAQTNQLLITGVALGSFGFEFELPQRQNSLSGGCLSLQVMNKIESLFAKSVFGEDDEITEIINEISPRVMVNIRAFLNVMRNKQAYCTIEHDKGGFCFENYEQLKKSVERLDKKNISEKKETYVGEFRGVLPEERKFEFYLFSSDKTLHGKISPSIKNPEELNRDWLYKTSSIELNVVSVGKGTPGYTLLSYQKVN